MLKKTTRQILMSDDFFLPFGGKLNKNNRWVKLAAIIPWWTLEERYEINFKATKKGEKPFNVRVALGTLIIQTRLNLSDRETVNQIMENPYLQYFIGYDRYDDQKPPFDASMLVHFRKRLTSEILMEINELIAREAALAESSRDNNNDDDQPPKTGGSSDGGDDAHEERQGQLILDATCAPADIRFPTDLRLLNEAREKLERIIDTLHGPDVGVEKKPRTYRKEARNNYLSVEKQRKKHRKTIRKAIRKQLGFVARDLGIIDRYLQEGRESLLSQRQLRHLETIRLLHEQQQIMYTGRHHSAENRIVSVTQPHIRPIVRGKAGASVEFGAKVLTSVVGGYSFIERMSFDSYNEGSYLIEAVESYKSRFGFYPEAVMADTIFRNRANLLWLKERGIRISGPRLGRPSKDKSNLKAQKEQIKKDSGIRNAVEGSYGNAKRLLGLDCIKAKLQETAESSIVLHFLVLNLERRLRVLLSAFLEMLFSRFRFNKIGLLAV